jgi:hypothetical protein
VIVYGDRSRRVRADDVRAALARARVLEPGAARHAALTSAFLDLAAMAQAVADQGFEQRGHDAPEPADETLMFALTELARVLLQGWNSEASAALPDLPPMPDEVTARVPEGHAFYALYLEAHALAARRLALEGPPRVIGIRSIGTGLAAVAAAALGAPPPITLRPAGHPFARHVQAAPSCFSD